MYNLWKKKEIYKINPRIVELCLIFISSSYIFYFKHVSRGMQTSILEIKLLVTKERRI